MGKIVVAGFAVFAVVLIAVLVANRGGNFASVQTGTDGAAVYQEFCAQCHGPQGEGRVNLTPPLRGRNLPVSRIKEVVRRGGLKMPPLRFIQGEALENVARHVTGMK